MGCGDPVNSVQLDPSKGPGNLDPDDFGPSLENSLNNRIEFLERENERLYNSLVTIENELRQIGGEYAVNRARATDLTYEIGRLQDRYDASRRELAETKRVLRKSQETTVSLLGEKTARIMREVEERKSADGGSAEHQPERDGEDRQGSSQG